MRRITPEGQLRVYLELVESMDTHSHTPGLTVVDSRGLIVRKVAYHRASESDPPREDVTRITFDLAGRITELRDPRLWALAQNDPHTQPNRTHLYSLSSLPLLSVSVDEGWDLSLLRESGVVDRSWESKGASWHSDYDELLRPIAKHETAPNLETRTMSRCVYADGSEASATHNKCGQIVELYDNAGLRKCSEFGILGQCLIESRQFLQSTELPDWSQSPVLDVEKTTSSTVNALGEVLTQTDASGNRQRFTQDIAGATKRVHLALKDDTENLLLSEVNYNALGQVESETAGNGVVSTCAYDPITQRLQCIVTQKGALLSQKLEYRYDPVGNVTEITDSAQVVRYFRNQEITPTNLYRYDSLYQLIEASGRESATVTGNYPPPENAAPDPGDTSQFLNYSETCRYDQAGNMLELRHVRDGNNYTRTFAISETSNRSLQRTDEQPNPDFDTAFDVAGNLLALQPGRTLQWGLRNQLTKIATVTRTDAANDEEIYVYDGGDQRVRKLRTFQAQSIARKQEVFYLPGLEVRLTGTDTNTSEHLEVITVQAGRSSIRCLHWISGKPDDVPNKQIRYGLNDSLGSCSMEFDGNAELLNHEGYLPFGGTAWWAARGELGGKYKTIRYSGKERDASGLYYYGYRYYAPWLQRWINPDPGGEIDGLNLYRMTNNSPITFLDTNGSLSVEAQTAYDSLEDTKNRTVQHHGPSLIYQMSVKQPNRAYTAQHALSASRQTLRNALTYDIDVHLKVLSETGVIIEAGNMHLDVMESTSARNLRGAANIALNGTVALMTAGMGLYIGQYVSAWLGWLIGVAALPLAVNTVKAHTLDPLLKRHQIAQRIRYDATDYDPASLWNKYRTKEEYVGTSQDGMGAQPSSSTSDGLQNLTMAAVPYVAGVVTGEAGLVGGPLVDVGVGLYDVASAEIGASPHDLTIANQHLESAVAMLNSNLEQLKAPMLAVETGRHPGIITGRQLYTYDNLRSDTSQRVSQIRKLQARLLSKAATKVQHV